MSVFVGQIRRMNDMYRLQIADKPTIDVKEYKDGELVPSRCSERLRRFKKSLEDEIKEIDLIIAKAEQLEALEERDPEVVVDLLTDIADVTADLQVFCASEQMKFGLPSDDVMDIVMESNFSKLGADGKPIYDDFGKFQKGPNYWKPEPKISQLIRSLLP